MSSFRTLTMFALSALAAAAQTTLLTDSFADGNRTSSPTWYLLSNGSTTNSITSQSWAFTAGTVARTITTQFTPYTMAVGDTVSASFNLTTAAGASFSANNNAVRFGLFNANSSFPSADNTTSQTSTTQWGPWTGYWVNSDPSSGTLATNTGEFRERFSNTGTSMNGPMNGTTGSNQLTTTVSSGTFQATGATNSTYLYTLSLTKTSGSTMSLSYTIYNQTSNTTYYTLGASDSSLSVSTFDTLALQINSPQSIGGATYTLDNFTVSTVPEPSTYAALLGAAGLALVVWRRRQSSTT